MMAGAGAVAPFMFTVALNEVLWSPSLTLTVILLSLTVPVTASFGGTGLSP
jgi:hypothetical protein